MVQITEIPIHPKHTSPGTDKRDPAISSQEKWRLIQESGILNNLNSNKTEHKQEAIDKVEPPGTLFKSFIYAIPFCTLYLMFEIILHKQFAEELAPAEAVLKYLKSLPIFLVTFAICGDNFFRNKYYKFAAFLIGLLLGIKLMSLVGTKNGIGMVYGELQSCSGIATLWIYLIYQMDILSSVALIGCPLLYYLYFK